ncbi:protein phosphatase inhibitor 2-like [Oratosquilla oratoria]|uniref:protein phosphatase inhibitor 2-like n=1 Tax=Oratosquilla oratoria TaxID=337810 RepID=UPI003F767995
MADKLSKQPKKGILKNSSSFEGQERNRELSKGTKWDEMNILATHHPKDKDYGHMKIEEPKTPYNYATEENISGDEADGLDADLLARKIQIEGGELPRALQEPEEEESEEEESPEEREKRKVFEMKRKQHYNEYYAVKLARKLMEDDSDEDDEEEKLDSKEKELEEGCEEEKMIEDSQDEGAGD